MIRRFLDKISGRGEKYPFVALGDSIISDCYPGPGRGVASLLARRLPPPVERWGHCRSGYQLIDLEGQLPSLKTSRDCSVVLISVGGNDLMNLDHLPGEAWFLHFGQQYRHFLEQLFQRYPLANFLILNVYDPSDGTGRFPGREEKGLPPRPEMLPLLARLNQEIADVAGPYLVDIHSACWGHGWSGRKPLWFQRDIEPNQEGASQLCDLLLKRLEGLRGRVDKGRA